MRVCVCVCVHVPVKQSTTQPFGCACDFVIQLDRTGDTERGGLEKEDGGEEMEERRWRMWKRGEIHRQKGVYTDLEVI